MGLEIEVGFSITSGYEWVSVDARPTHRLLAGGEGVGSWGRDEFDKGAALLLHAQAQDGFMELDQAIQVLRARGLSLTLLVYLHVG